MKSNDHVLRSAKKYIRRGWCVVPIPAKEKAPRLKGWQKLQIKESEIPEYFEEGCNIGILLGAPSKGLIDVDLDCDEVIAIASRFLPKTNSVFGRKSRPRSHYLYQCKDVKPIKFNDPDPPDSGDACLLELRSTGQQSVAPPSIHPSGERVRWDEDGEALGVSPNDIVAALEQLAVAALLARRWKKGARDQITLSLSGALLRAGWKGEEVTEFIVTIADSANDDETEKRVAAVEDTKEKIDAGKEVTGIPTLVGLLGEKTVNAICEWLGIGKKEARTERVDGNASQATKLVTLAEQARFFHTVEHEPFACMEIDLHRETWHLKSPHFKRWLAARFYQNSKTAPSTQALNDALGVLAGKALFGSPKKEVFSRLAERDGKIYLDLCDSSWQAVEITNAGWKVVSHPPIRFRRSRGMLALPIPERGGSIDELRPFLNVGSDSDFLLLISWLVCALGPHGPYPVLVLQGEAGSAKSTTAHVLRELVDPSTSPLRSEPREVRDLMIAANNSWVIAYDNISYQPPWLSDALCRLATGGGFSTRELYTDDQEKVFNATRPVLLNGIDAVVIRGDLMDRSIILYLPVIAEEQRKPERQFWQSFRSVQARILGALLDAVACALQRLPHVELKRMPRMADFARWAVAAGPALGLDDGAFTRAYDSNRAAANVLTLEASPIATSLQRVCTRGHWTGTALDLLAKLNAHTEEDEKRQRSWPKNPQQLSVQLRRLAPNLRPTGLDIHFDEQTPGSRSKRLMTITRRNPLQDLKADLIRPSLRPIYRFPRPFRFPR